jgi:hypothetical protein
MFDNPESDYRALQEHYNANEPHEYVGAEVDIGVGSVFEPCHLCGRENYESLHQAQKGSE